MRLLDRYLLRELAVPLAYCLVGFLLFWITFDLFAELEEFQKNNVPPAKIAEYYLIKTPELLVTVLPVALLLALLYALTNHARNNEIVAMRAAGLSLGRISIPYLLVGIIFSLALLAMNETVVARNMGNADRLVQPKKEDDKWAGNVNIRNAREKRIWNIQRYHTETGEMLQPQVEWLQPSGATLKVFSQRAIRTNNLWLFLNAEIRTYVPGVPLMKSVVPTFTNAVAFADFTETPADLALYIRFRRIDALEASKRVQLRLDEIQYLRTHMELNPRDRALLETQYHARLAEPWRCLVVVFIALPFGTLTSRRNVFTGVASSIFICFTYFILLRLGQGLATGGIIPAFIGAWSPNIFFSIAGIWATIRSK